MNFKSWLHVKLYVFALVFALAFTTACDDDDDDPISPSEQHFDASGLYIEMGGLKVFDYYGPDHTIKDTLGPIDLNVGDNGHWNVHFYDSNKEIIDGPQDADKYLVVEIQDTSKVIVDDLHHDLSEAPSEMNGWTQYRFKSGAYGFHIKGLKASTQTLLKVKVYHIDHYDFTTLPIVITVGSNVSTLAIKLYEETDLTQPIANVYQDDYSGSSIGFSIPASSTKALVARVFSAVIANGTETLTEKFPASYDSHNLLVETSNSAVVSSGNITFIDHPTQTGHRLWKIPVTAGATSGSAELSLKIRHDQEVVRAFNSMTVTVQ